MKSYIRKAILEKRSKVSVKEVKSLSQKIRTSLFSLKEYKSAKAVMFYVSFNKEVSTREMIKEALKTKTVIVPKCVKNEIAPYAIKSIEELKKGTLGILEPKTKNIFPKEKIDLIIVPGIAFDKRGFRIGYGKGYYDRFLKNLKAKKIALAFEFQVIKKVPENEKDVPVDMVVTEKRIVECC